MRIQNLCDGADFAKRLNIENVVTHMGFIPENPYDTLFEGFLRCSSDGGRTSCGKRAESFVLKPVRKRRSR